MASTWHNSAFRTRTLAILEKMYLRCESY